MYPTGEGSLKFYGLPKIHNTGVFQRSKVLSKGTVTYETAEKVARILKATVDRSPHHVHNTKDFMHQIRHIKLEEDECISSYDVKAIFILVPIEPALKVIKNT